MKRNNTHDLTGRRFDMLVVESFAGYRDSIASWYCICDCGRTKTSFAKELLSGKNKSCGCARARGGYRHGQTESRVHLIWKGMHQRCRNPNNPNFKNYGGRGIEICERWFIFENFHEDMGDPPAGLTLDRKNNSLGYEPKNCRWATRGEQSRNTRRNKRFSVNGKNYTNVVDYAREHGINKFTLYKQLSRSGFVL